MKKLAVVTTHPIQYNAPLFQLLTERNNVSIKVFYTWGESVLQNKFDPGFGKSVDWDIPLLHGYQFAFVNNISTRPGSHHYNGIDNSNLNKEIEDWKADAILVFGWNFKSHLKAMKYFHNKIPVFFRGDSTLLDRKNGIKNIFKKFYLKWVYSYVDRALYVGKENKRYYRYAGLKEEQLVFAPHAIDNSRFSFDEASAQEIRTSLNIPKEAVVFLFAGKLEPKKNPALLLHAFMQLNDAEAHLIMAGNGILENELKTEYTNNTHIHFLPFQNQSQMPGLYSACDIFVLPSKGPGETWGLAVNEAMACGRAVLVSDKCGCASDLVSTGKNGFIFESGKEEDLLLKMKYFVVNKSRLPFMGTQSKEIIGSWCYPKVCEAIERIV